MSCCYISMSCHVMSWHVGMGGFWLGHLAISDEGTISRRHRWVFVGPCHLCVHGPPAFPFDSGFLTHTHSKLPLEQWHLCCFACFNRKKGSFTAFRASSIEKRLPIAHRCIKVSGCSASKQRPTKGWQRHGAVSLSVVL